MRRILGLLAVVGLAACGAETGSDDEACQQADTVVAEINTYIGYPELTPEQVNDTTQWEFRLAEAAVIAVDRDLASELRRLADAAANVGADLTDSNAKIELDSIYETVGKYCN